MQNGCSVLVPFVHSLSPITHKKGVINRTRQELQGRVMPCIRCTGTVHLIHLVQFILTADYFSHICFEVPGLEHTDQKFRDNKKREIHRTTELPLGSPAQETIPLFPEQDVNRNQHQLKNKQDSGQAESLSWRELLVQSLVLSVAMYSEGRASSLMSPKEKTKQTNEITITNEDQHSVSLEGSGVRFLLRIAIKKCCTRWKQVQPLP